jgi:hypothetical protein
MGDRADFPGKSLELWIKGSTFFKIPGKWPELEVSRCSAVGFLQQFKLIYATIGRRPAARILGC